MEAHLQAQGIGLAARLRSLSPVARVCAVKGLVSFLSVPALLCTLKAAPGALFAAKADELASFHQGEH